MSYKFNPFSRKPDYYEAGTTGSVDDVARDNIVNLAWRLAIAEGLSVFNLEDGVVDEFEDETGVDTGASSNQTYDETNDYYSPSSGTVVDNMEYSSDVLARAAYVTDDAGSNVYNLAQSNMGSGFQNLTIRSIVSAAGLGDTVHGRFRVLFQAGTSNDLIIISAYLGESAGGASPQNFKTSPAKVQLLFSGNAGVTITASGTKWSDWVSFTTDGTVDLLVSIATGNNNYISGKSSGAYGAGYKSGNDAATDEVTGYTWQAGYSYIVYQVESTSTLNCFSESSIKTQGSYSLKGVAVATDSLNKTLTRNLASAIDLSGVSWVQIDLRSDRASNNITFGWQQSISVSASLTPSLTSAGSFERFIWSLDAISNGAKNSISALYITLINADASNTFYVDGWAGPLGNMTLISESTEAEEQPTEARFLALIEPVDTITVNTDIKGYVSEDDGSNYDQVTLTDEGYFDSTKKILAGNVTLTDRSDQTMVQKIETANNKDLKVHAWGLLWS